MIQYYPDNSQNTYDPGYFVENMKPSGISQNDSNNSEFLLNISDSGRRITSEVTTKTF